MNDLLRGCRITLLLVVLLATGCVRTLIGGERSILSPDIIKYSVPTDTPKPPLKETPKPQPEATPAPVPRVDPALLPKEPVAALPVAAVAAPAAFPAGGPVSSTAEPPAGVPSAPPTASPSPTPPLNPPQTPSQATTEPAPAEGSRLPAPVPARKVTGKSRFASIPSMAYRNAYITEDTTWKQEVLVEGTLSVASQATLYIEPGTVVRVRSLSDAEPGLIAVAGRIVAAGTAAAPITFTGDGSGVEQGDWGGIVLIATTKKNQIEHCRIEAADTALRTVHSTVALKETEFSLCGTGIAASEGTVSLTGGGFSRCEKGIHAELAEMDLTRVSFSGNSSAIATLKSSLYLTGSTIRSSKSEGLLAVDSQLAVKDTTFTDNPVAVNLVDCRGQFSLNRVTESKSEGLRLTRGSVSISGNELTNNDVAIRVMEGSGLLWENAFHGSGRFDLVNEGKGEVTAIMNWWQDLQTGAPARILGRAQNPAKGPIQYAPVLSRNPRVP